jgi:exosortase
MPEQSGNGVLEEFRIEFLECWHKLPNKALFLVLFAAWLALFQFFGNPTLGYVKSASLMRWMLDAYHPAWQFFDSDDGHGVLVPFLVLLLFWIKRKELMGADIRAWPPALALIGFALALHVGAFMIQQPKISIIALFGGIYGLMGLAWGPQWLRRSLFPFFLLVFCIPLGTQGQTITTPLRHLVAIIVTAIAHLGIAPDLIRQGTQLMDADQSFMYDIAPACSGIRSLMVLLALTTIFGFLMFKTTWRRLLTVLAAFPLAVMGNVIRLTFTVLVAEMFGHEAGKNVEQKAGFVTFAVALVGVFLIERWLREPPDRIDQPVSGAGLEVKPT